MVWTPSTRAQHDRSWLRYASDMTDEEWALLEPLMPQQPERGRKRRVNLRNVLEGIFYVLQSGCAWRLIPKEFPPISTVHGYFRRFIKEGIWDRIMGLLHEQVREKAGRTANRPTRLSTASLSKQVRTPVATRVLTRARKSKGVNATSLSIRSALSCRPMFILPIFRIAMVAQASLTSWRNIFRSSSPSAATANMPGPSRSAAARGTWISSSAIRPNLKFFRSAGLSNAPLPG